MPQRNVDMLTNINRHVFMLDMYEHGHGPGQGPGQAPGSISQASIPFLICSWLAIHPSRTSAFGRRL